MDSSMENITEMGSTMENLTEMESERVEQSTTMENTTEMESERVEEGTTMENITEMDSEKVEQGTNNGMETGDQSQNNVKETENTNPGIETGGQSTNIIKENKNPGEIVGEEDPVREHKDFPSSMVIEDGTSLASSEVTPTLEKGTNDNDPPKIDDEKTHDDKNSLLKTSPPQSPSPSMPLHPDEELINPSVEDTVEQNIEPNEVSSDILKREGDAVKVDKDNAVVHEETTKIPDTKLSEDKGSPYHHAETVTELEKAAEEHDMISSGDRHEFPVNPDTKVAEENDDKIDEDEAKNKSLADRIDEDEAKNKNLADMIEEDEARDENLADRIDEDEAKNKSLANHGSGLVNHEQETTTELDKGPEGPGSVTVSILENKLSEPLTETSMNVEREPEMPATEILTDNDKISGVLAAEIPGDSEKGKSLLPTTQTLPDHDEGITTLEAEPMEDMKLDVPDSKLVADAPVDSTNNTDVNVEAATNAEKNDNSGAPEGNGADNEGDAMRCDPGPAFVMSSNIKSEVLVSGDLNNGVHKTDLPPPAFGGSMSTKHSFLLDDTSEGNESGTEEDQSAFMKELDNFFRERHMEFKPPKFYGEGLNCLKLWRAVTRLGGYDKVTGCKLWRQVGESFRPPKTCTTVSWTFRGFYEKALLEYERHKVSGGELHIPLASELEPMNIDNQASGSGRARRDAAARAMQGWHSQRNGDVSDPAIKDKNLVLHPKREKQIGTTPGLLKRKRPSSAEHGAKNAIQVSAKPMLDVTVVDVGPPADWVKINVQRTQDCFEVYALVPGLVREEVRVQSDPAGRLVISGEPENPMNPWGATPFKKVVNLPTRIDPHHTSAVVTLNGQLFVRVPLEQSD